MTNRTVLGLLYFLLFAGLALMGAGLHILHWIADKFGVYTMLGCLSGYTAVMAGLVWMVNKVGRSVPTLRLPPASTLPPPAYEMQDTMSYEEQGVKLDKSGTVKPSS